MSGQNRSHVKISVPLPKESVNVKILDFIDGSFHMLPNGHILASAFNCFINQKHTLCVNILIVIIF